MTWFEIRPKDVWLFRDGKPFSAGEDHSAHSMFPPSPMTLQGALRQKIAVSQGLSLLEYKSTSTPYPTPLAQQVADYIGPYGSLQTGLMKMAGPFVGLSTDTDWVPLIPAPADLLKHSDTDDFLITSLDVDLSSDLGTAYLFPHPVQDYENMSDFWLTADIFSDYLNGNAPNRSALLGDSKDAARAYRYGKHVFHNSAVYETEGRFGVDIDATTSFRREGLLYQTQYVRPHDCIGLLVNVSGIPDAAWIEGEMKLGGEQRMANVSAVPNLSLPSCPPQVSGQFKVVFLTPAFFAQGWRPNQPDWSDVFGQPIEFVSAALYRPQRLGGWNGASNQPRPMHNYVAPGSVYYFSTQQPLSLPGALTQDPSDMIGSSAIGFGQYAVGQW